MRDRWSSFQTGDDGIHLLLHHGSDGFQGGLIVCLKSHDQYGLRVRGTDEAPTLFKNCTHPVHSYYLARLLREIGPVEKCLLCPSQQP